MSSLDQILSKVVVRLDAIENRVTEKVDTVLNQTALNSPLTKLKIPKAGEVTLFGHFVWDPEVSGQEEIDLLLAGQWSPSILDFMAVTDLSPKSSIGNFEALLTAIAGYEIDSITRLNFFSHGNSVALGIAGSIVPDNVLFDHYVDESKIDFYAQAGLTLTETIKGKTISITLEDVRKRFKQDAKFVLYACHQGANREILKALSNLLHVTVVGFTHETIYCPPVQDTPPFRRKGTKLGINKKPGGCSKNETKQDWRSLINDESAIQVTYSGK